MRRSPVRFRLSPFCFHLPSYIISYISTAEERGQKGYYPEIGVSERYRDIETLLSNSGFYAVTFPKEAFGITVKSPPEPVDGLEYDPYDANKGKSQAEVLGIGKAAMTALEAQMDEDLLRKFKQDLLSKAQSSTVDFHNSEVNIDILSEFPAFKFPERVGNPTDISPVLNHKLMGKLFMAGSGVDHFTVLLCDTCPANLWIYYVTRLGHHKS